MNLSQLSVADISTLIAAVSRKMSKLEERTEANTKQWELLAANKSELRNEFEKRWNSIGFTQDSTEYQRSNWLANRLVELIPVEDRGKASDIVEDHLKHFKIQ